MTFYLSRKFKQSPAIWKSEIIELSIGQFLWEDETLWWVKLFLTLFRDPCSTNID